MAKGGYQAGILFSIDLKVSGKIVTLNVEENDSIYNLLEKNNIIKETTSNDTYKKIKLKIEQSILKQIQNKKQENNFQLAQKLQHFLYPNLYTPNCFSASETPFKFLQATCKVNSLKQPTQGNKLEDVINDNSIKSDIQVIQDQNFVQRTLNKQNRKPYLNNSKQKSNKKSKKSTDSDLLKAYQIIMKKSKDRIMRQMAGQALKQTNVQKEQNTPIINVENKKVDLKQLIIQKDIEQFKDIRFSTPSIQNFHSQKVETQSQMLPSKNISFEQKNKNGYNYSKLLKDSECDNFDLYYEYQGKKISYKPENSFLKKQYLYTNSSLMNYSTKIENSLSSQYPSKPKFSSKKYKYLD